MASVHKHPNSPFWMASVRVWVPDETTPQGGHFIRTTKSTKIPVKGGGKRLAQDRAEKWEREANEKMPDLSEHEAAEFFRRSVARLMDKGNIQSDQFRPKWDTFSQTWLSGIPGAKRSLQKYKAEIARLTKFLGPRKSIPMEQITEKDLRGWYARMLKDGFGSTTAFQAFKTIRRVFSAAKERELIRVNVAKLVRIEGGAGHKRRPFKVAEIQQLLAYLDKAKLTEWRTAVLFGLIAAMRLGDARKRRGEEIDEQGVLRFVPAKKLRMQKEVALPMVGELANLPRRGLLTPTLATMEHGSSSKAFMAILKAAEIEIKRSGKRGKGKSLADVSFHSLRHTCNSWLADEGVDRRVRQLISDHDDSATNDRYTAPEIATMRAAAQKLAVKAGITQATDTPKPTI